MDYRRPVQDVLAKIYDIRRYGKWVFLTIAAAVVVIFLYVSSNMVRDLARSERERMQIWADATKEIVKQLDAEAGDPNIPGADIDFLLRIIEGNTTIPVLLTDDAGNILNYRNFTLPEPVDSLNPMEPVS